MNSLGYDKFIINLIDKNNLDNELIKIDFKESKLIDIYNISDNNKYYLYKMNMKLLLDNDFLNKIFNSNIPNIFIFKNMSWEEVITYFRKLNYIISGGKPSERHIMTDERFVLSLFLKSINNINITSDSNSLYTSTSNLFYLFRFNNRNFKNFIKSNVNLTDKDIDKNIDDRINYFINSDVSLALKNEIKNFLDNNLFINKLYRLLNESISKYDLNLFIKNIKDENNILIDDSDDIYKELIYLFDKLNNISNLNIDIDLDIKNNIINIINNIVLKIKLNKNSIKKSKKQKTKQNK